MINLDYRLWIHFTDGTEDEIDLKDELWGDMFEPLRPAVSQL